MRALYPVYYTVFAVLLLQCANNVTDFYSDDRIELESVWQYLKAYSIHQDECVSGSGETCRKRLGDSPFAYSSPSAMMDSMHDTLKGNHYTCYYSTSGLSGSLKKSTGTSYVTFYELTQSTAMIQISNEFKTGVTYNQFKSTVNGLTSDYKNIIIDLRGNLGGDLEELDSILEMILPANTGYVLARERKYDTVSGSFKTFDYHPYTTHRGSNILLQNKKYVVLMDQWTASASEILAVALKDCLGATLAGQRSYGKAMGQIRLHRRGRNALQITFLQLKGIKSGEYQRIGLKPDSLIVWSADEADNIYNAVKILEPQILPSAIKYPSRLSKSASTDDAPSGYVNIYEE